MRRIRLITTADDFGLSVGVNEAVQQAATQGILTSASLMVAGPEAADAVARARDTPGLAVGLHVVVIEGTPVLPPEQIPDLVDEHGQFPSGQLSLGLNYCFLPKVRRQLATEIRAQFAAFCATGLTLDHANAHKHMHLHPVVGRMMIDIGRAFGLRAIRIPAEPRSGADTLGAKALRSWCAVLRRQARRAGLLTNDHVFGLRDTGHMTPKRVNTLLRHLPPGLTELYFHPASHRDTTIATLMPNYEHIAELESLLGTVLAQDIVLTTYSKQVAK